MPILALGGKSSDGITKALIGYTLLCGKYMVPVKVPTFVTVMVKGNKFHKFNSVDDSQFGKSAFYNFNFEPSP